MADDRCCCYLLRFLETKQHPHPMRFWPQLFVWQEVSLQDDSLVALEGYGSWVVAQLEMAALAAGYGIDEMPVVV